MVFEATRAIRALPGGARLPVIGVSAQRIAGRRATGAGEWRGSLYSGNRFREEEIFAGHCRFFYRWNYVYYTGDVTETAETAVAAPATAAIPPELIAALRDAVLEGAV